MGTCFKKAARRHGQVNTFYLFIQDRGFNSFSWSQRPFSNHGFCFFLGGESSPKRQQVPAERRLLQACAEGLAGLQ